MAALHNPNSYEFGYDDHAITGEASGTRKQ